MVTPHMHLLTPSLQATCIVKQHPSMTHPLISQPLTPSPPHPSLQAIVKQHSDLTVLHPLTPSPPHPSLQGPFHSFFPHGFRTRTISNFSRRKMPLSPLWRGTCGRGISFQHLIVTVRNGSLIRLASFPGYSACSMQIWREIAREIWLHVMVSGRQRWSIAVQQFPVFQ